jgi:hypothetical protein
MALIATQDTNSTAGLAVTWTAASASDTFTNTGEEIVLWRNLHAANAYTATITSAGTKYGLSLSDPTRGIAANGGVSAFGPCAVDAFGSTVTVAHSGSTSLEIAVIRPVRTNP